MRTTWKIRQVNARNLLDDFNRLHIPEITQEMLDAKVAKLLDGGIVAPLSSLLTKQPPARYSIRTAWRGEMKATAQTTRAHVMAKHADLFNRAKAGDPDAAADLIEKVVKPEKVRALIAEHPNASIVAPVYAEEANCRNKLPMMFAEYIADMTEIDVDDGIVQTVRAFHTGSSAEHRLFKQAEFDGPVRNGAEYIIVDDHITQGGTVNALRDYIESQGGKVVAVSALTLSQGSSILSPRKETIDEIKRKWPDINRLLRTAGIADRVEALTESQLRYVLKFSPDSFRDRIAQAVKQGIARTQYETLGAPSEGVAREETEAGREAMRHSVFVGRKAAMKRIVDWDSLNAACMMFFGKYKGKYTDKARDEIYVKTGWWQGTDGLWCFELADVKPKQRGKTMGKTVVNGLYGYGDSTRKWCDIGDMVSHTKLFRTYPKLKGITVIIADPDEIDFSAQYDPNRNVITLDWDGVEWYDGEPSNVLNDSGLASITHELQHAVQYLEDFAKGGSPEYHGERNYMRLAGEVEARNAARRVGYGQGGRGPDDGYEVWRTRLVQHTDAPWQTEDVKREKQILADGYGAMTDVRGNPVARRSVRRMDTEADARRAIVAQSQAEGNKAANDALENYVAYFKLSHGSIPRPQTLARIGLSLGMNVVDPKRILRNADRLAEEMRGIAGR